MDQHLYLIMCKHIASKRICTYIRPDLVRKTQHSHLTMCKHITLEWLSTYIQPHLVGKALHLHSTMCKHIASKGHALTYNHEGTNLIIALECPPVLD